MALTTHMIINRIEDVVQNGVGMEKLHIAAARAAEIVLGTTAPLAAAVDKARADLMPLTTDHERAVAEAMAAHDGAVADAEAANQTAMAAYALAVKDCEARRVEATADKLEALEREADEPPAKTRRSAREPKRVDKHALDPVAGSVSDADFLAEKANKVADAAAAKSKAVVGAGDLKWAAPSADPIVNGFSMILWCPVWARRAPKTPERVSTPSTHTED